MLLDFAASPPAKAFWFGILSAVSLPLGAMLGIWIKPNRIVTSSVMAFGAGSLLAALTFELVSPAFTHSGFPPLAVGCITGGVLFFVLNQAVNNKGGFLRKRATTLRHLVRSEQRRMQSRVRHLAAVDVLQGIPATELPGLMEIMARRKFKAGQIVYKRGEFADSFFLIDSGEVEVLRQGEPVSLLKDGDSFGTRSFFSEEMQRYATFRTRTPVKAWEVFTDSYEEMARRFPVIAENLAKLNLVRTEVGEQRRQALSQVEQANMALGESHEVCVIPSYERLSRGAGSAAMAIWLGIFLDGIPESMVIGASMVHTTVSWALIIGLFLANLPEAMSSAVGMREQGMSVTRIFLMWASLCLLTGVGALAGNIFLEHTGHMTFAVFEGVAAGAMLAMVAETMLPEAYHQGGPVVGMNTLLGFLAALFIKSLQ